MKIGIICADDRELKPFISMIKSCKTTEKAMLDIYEGKVAGVDVAALFSGPCKTNAALATQILIDTYGCDIIINSGTAGGMDVDVKLLDTVISTEAAYHDVSDTALTQYHPKMKSLFFKADAGLIVAARNAVGKIETGHSVHFGRMASGEKFIVQDKRKEINERLQPLCVDMETAAIAHVCHVNSVPFVSVRTITDTADLSGEANYDMNCDAASRISADIVGGIIDNQREKQYYDMMQRGESRSAESNEMKEKFICLLEAKGIVAEMGITPVTDMFVMHMEDKEDMAGDYWFVETTDSIETRVTNFIRWNIGNYIFALVEGEDYVNGKYAVGQVNELKDFSNPSGVKESADFMTMTFDEMIEAIK